MGSLMTTGLTSALLSSKTYYNTAVSPMQRASKELQNLHTLTINIDNLNKNLEYGSREMVKSGQATLKAGVELQKALKIAGDEARALLESRIEERRERNSERAKEMASGGEVHAVKAKDKEINALYNKDTSDKKKNNMWDYNSKESYTNYLNLSKKYANSFSVSSLYNKAGGSSSWSWL